MPTYTVSCGVCGEQEDVYLPVRRHGEWPECCGAQMRQIVKAAQIVRDIEPYRAVAVDIATGKAPIIGGRRSHKEFLRRNGYVEVGNDPIRPAGMPGDKLDSPKREIVKAYKEATGNL
jgi:hypothetical protein